MTAEDRLNLLKKAVADGGQGKVAAAIGYGRSTVSQVLSGTYKGDATQVLARVEEVYGTRTVACPVQGDILIGQCADNRRRSFSAVNPIRLELSRTCPTCKEAEK